ncbi:F16A2 protein, partial [Alcedo cyanopectus]|nr:F16A2 protein [Ceyx cyanopectus]
ISSLGLFMNSLEFCNAVIQVAHPLVQKQLVDYVHNGFLVPVMGPALHKVGARGWCGVGLPPVPPSPPIHGAAPQHPPVPPVRGHSCQCAPRATRPQLCMVSLSLFRTLLSLNCEDVMLQLVLRYLLPCSHVMLSQRRAVRDLDIYGRTAAKFLSLIPRCCHPHSPPATRGTGTGGTGGVPVAWPRAGASSPPSDSRPSTPSRLSFFLRQPQSPEPHSVPGTPPGPPPHSPPAPPWDEVSELDGNYLEYLRDARCSIDRCALACRVWSAPYDGEDPGGPPPADAKPPTPRTKKRGLLEDGGAPGCGGPRAGTAAAAAVGTERRGSLVNGVRPAGDVAVKKVRRCPQGEGEGDGTPRAQPPGWGDTCPAGVPSVDSLLEELLAQAPAEPNGAGVTIEAFTAELRELEMRVGGGEEDPAGPTLPDAPELSREEEEAFASFASLPEGEATGRAPPKPPDPLAQLVASPPRALGVPPSQPFTGPFVSALFGKLENMLHNSLYVNCLLTGLVAQLACYPQPLLRSFLLNTNMVFQPSVKSLLQVLGTVKNKIEAFAAGQEDFPALLFRAKKYLIARGRMDWHEGAGSALRRPDATAPRSRKPSLGELLLRHANSPTRARPAAPPPTPPCQPAPGEEGAAPRAPALAAGRAGDAPRVKNAVYCAVIFCEFLKELAAIAQAHAVTSPFLTE